MEHTATLPKLVRLMKGLVPIAALAVLAVPAQGQAINYFTQGYFTSAVYPPCNDAVPTVGMGQVGNTCSGGGFSLQYLPTAGVNIGSGSITSLGQFLLTGTGTAALPPGILTFTLNVDQTSPGVGQAVFLGALSGTVSTDPTNTSSLIWTPNQFQTINANETSTQYELIFDNVGYAANTGLGIPVNNQRGINALVETTATPEPATASLMATGLLGLAGMVRRRKRVTDA